MSTAGDNSIAVLCTGGMMCSSLNVMMKSLLISDEDRKAAD